MRWAACGESMRLRFSARAESGSILVEFLGSALLIIFALLGVAQMSIWVWSRGVVVNAAHEGARAAAEVDSSIVAAEWTTRAVLRDGLGAKGNEFTITAARTGGVVRVEVRGESPRIIDFMPSFPIVGRSTVLDESTVWP